MLAGWHNILNPNTECILITLNVSVMQDNNRNQEPDQLNPGQNDQFGNEAVIKKNEGISDQGNEWADKESINDSEKNILGKKAEKYIKESADVEDLPEESDQQEAEEINKVRNASVADDDDGEDTDEVIEDEDEQLPGYDLGRNKVQ